MSTAEKTGEVEDRIREVLRCWSKKRALAEMARERHGFGNSDGGFGVCYPESAEEMGEKPIPPGHVEIYGYWGPPDGYEHVVEEGRYLRVLATFLDEQGLPDDAEQVRRLLTEA